MTATHHNTSDQYPETNPQHLGEQSGFVDNLRISLETHPLTATGLDYYYKARSDMERNDGVASTIAWATGMVAMQVVDRARLVLIYAPPVAIEIMDRTNNEPHSSSVAGLAVAIMFGVSNGLTGKTLAKTLSQFPETRQAVAEKNPAMVEIFKDALPVTDTDTTNAGFFAKFRHQRKLAKTAMLIGSTAPVAVTSLSDKSAEELSKINRDITVAGMAGAFALVATVGEAVRELALKGHYELAEDIKGVIGNEKWWLLAAGALVINDLIQSKLKKRKLRAVTDLTPEISD